MADVRLSNVSKYFGSNLILRQIELEVRDGEFMVFVGPSGCGKSTLLRLIAGLEDISEGDLWINGKQVNDLPPSQRGIAMVFQSYALYPHLHVYDNMAFGLRLAKVAEAEIDLAVRQAAQLLHIEHLLARKPKDLSGGQRQRVAIGRAIVRKPAVFLFDEPLSNLDTALRVRMRYEFARLHQAFKTTMIYVTHDQVEAMTLADRIVVLSAGRIEQVGSPMALYEHPDNLFVARFIGSPGINLLQGEVVQASSQGARVCLVGGEMIECRVDARTARVGDIVTLGVRPEHFAIDADGNTIHTHVTFVECLGNITYAYCSHPASSEVLTVVIGRHARARTGESLLLNAPPDCSYLFDAQGQAYRRLINQEQSGAA